MLQKDICERYQLTFWVSLDSGACMKGFRCARYFWQMSWHGTLELTFLRGIEVTQKFSYVALSHVGLPVAVCHYRRRIPVFPPKKWARKLHLCTRQLRGQSQNQPHRDIAEASKNVRPWQTLYLWLSGLTCHIISSRCTGWKAHKLLQMDSADFASILGLSDTPQMDFVYFGSYFGKSDTPQPASKIYEGDIPAW